MTEGGRPKENDETHYKSNFSIFILPAFQTYVVFDELNVYRSNGNHTVFFRGNFQIKRYLEDMSLSEENMMIFML